MGNPTPLPIPILCVAFFQTPFFVFFVLKKVQHAFKFLLGLLVSTYGAFAPGSESSWERKFQHSLLSAFLMILSLLSRPMCFIVSHLNVFKLGLHSCHSLHIMPSWIRRLLLLTYLPFLDTYLLTYLLTKYRSFPTSIGVRSLAPGSFSPRIAPRSSALPSEYSLGHYPPPAPRSHTYNASLAYNIYTYIHTCMGWVLTEGANDLDSF